MNKITSNICGCGHAIEQDRVALGLATCQACAETNPDDPMFGAPKCPAHGAMTLVHTHRESGGVVPNYWTCQAPGCQHRLAARNKKEAEQGD